MADDAQQQQQQPESKSETVYVVSSYTVTDPERYKKYVAALGTLKPEFGCEILSLSKAPYNSPEDKPIKGTTTVLLSFPSEEKYRAWYSSPEYQAALPHRTESTTDRTYLVLPAGVNL